MSDYGTDKLATKLPPLLEFIAQAKQANEKILVHCQLGANRSPTVVLAYLVKHEEMTLKEAVRHVKKRRPLVHPVDRYLLQLRALEKEWTGRCTLSEEDQEHFFPSLSRRCQAPPTPLEED
ncbi:Dual specificity protein phosphatase 6 [Balamuthia mandrillaris]